MKVLLTTILLMAVTLLPATDFILKDGTTVIGTLKGILDQSMYVVTDSGQLHVLPFDTVQAINDGSGDVSYVWKMKKPFMDINPKAYDVINSPTNSAQVDILQVPPTPRDPYEHHLASISTALWTMNIVTISSLVVAVLTYLHYTK
jgi:hypothetical protein